VNNDGVWNETGASLALVVAPTFWQTAWFRGAALLGLIALLTAAYRTRVALLDRRRAGQEAFSRQLINSQEEERQRIAAELHDSLGQNLIVIKNRAALALIRMNPSEPAAAMISDVSDMASATIQEVRAIAQNLRPYQIDQFGLTHAIHSMVRQMAEASAIEFKTEVDPIDGVLPAAHEIVVYRIAQECLSNVVKHSRARRVTLRVRRDVQSLRLSVSDDGCGFVQGQTGSSGFGSRNIVERARAMRGTAFIDSKPGEGTCVEVVLPIPTS
jgi:signal transduction histidine kinase